MREGKYAFLSLCFCLGNSYSLVRDMKRGLLLCSRSRCGSDAERRMACLKKIVRTFAVVLGVLGVVALCAYGLRVRTVVKPQKTLDRDVVEGLRIWNPKTGVDAIRIGSCRLEKRRLGLLTLGGCNVLVMTNVVLNLPLPAEATTNLARAVALPFADEGETTSDDRKNGDAAAFLSGLHPSFVRASSIRAADVSVNRVVGKTVVPVFRADSLRNRGAKIVLGGCRVIEGGKTNCVGRATLSLRPRPLLAWNGGQRSLEDLLPVQHEGTKK